MHDIDHGLDILHVCPHDSGLDFIEHEMNIIIVLSNFKSQFIYNVI